MPTVVEKKCSACGEDVSQRKRTKDSKGNYYCNECWPGSLVEQPTVTPESCGNCGTKLGALQQRFDWLGEKVCWACNEVLTAEQRRREPVLASPLTVAKNATPSGSDPSTDVQTVLSNRWKRWVTLTNVFVPMFVVSAAFLCLAVAGLLGHGRDQTEMTFALGWLTVILAPFVIFCVLKLWLNRGGRPSAQKAELVNGASIVPPPPPFLAFALYLLIPAFVFWVSFFFTRSFLDDFWGWVAWIPGIVCGLIAFGIGGAIATRIALSKCPKCKKLNVAEIVSTLALGSNEWLETQQQRGYIRDKSGSMVGSFDTPVQVQVVENRWQEFCKCKLCQFEWNRVRWQRFRR